MSGTIELGPSGSEITLPRPGMRLQRSRQEIKQEERTADGTLVSDLRAVKMQFRITYEPFTTGTVLDSLLDLYDLHEELNLIIHNEDDSTTEYTVRMELPGESRVFVRDIWAWSGVEILLAEV